MAEPLGLAIGDLGLAADYISLGRNYGADYQQSLTKMILLKARLNAWGESLHPSRRA